MKKIIIVVFGVSFFSTFLWAQNVTLSMSHMFSFMGTQYVQRMAETNLERIPGYNPENNIKPPLPITDAFAIAIKYLNDYFYGGEDKQWYLVIAEIRVDKNMPFYKFTLLNAEKNGCAKLVVLMDGTVPPIEKYDDE